MKLISSAHRVQTIMFPAEVWEKILYYCNPHTKALLCDSSRIFRDLVKICFMGAIQADSVSLMRLAVARTPMENPESIATRASNYYAWRIVVWFFGDLYPELAFRTLVEGGKYRTAERFYCHSRRGVTSLAFTLYLNSPEEYSNILNATMWEITDQWQYLLEVATLRDLPHILFWLVSSTSNSQVVEMASRMGHHERRTLAFRVLQRS